MSRWLAIAALLTVAAALPAEAQPDAPAIGAHGALAPATYAGVTRCRDCDGVRHHLDLWPDQSFHLRTERLGSDHPETRDYAGRWHADGERGAIVLDLGSLGEAVFAVRNSQRMSLLAGPTGVPSDDTDYDLVTEGALTPTEVSLSLSGMFTYFADAPRIVHCATGVAYPVAQEGDYLAAERTYLAKRSAPGEPLFVTMEATITERPPMEGHSRPHVVVDAFGAAWPGETCERAAAAPALVGTIWRFTELDGESFDWTGDRPEPHLVMRSADTRFSATVGCNTKLGGYELEGKKLRFLAVASTMMACLGPLEDWETRLNRTLQETAGYRIGGRTLLLLDAGGSPLAQLEAAYVRD